MKAGFPSVVVVAPALNEAAILPRFVAAFDAFRSSVEPLANVRLLVVDDGSTDGTLQVLRNAAAAGGDRISYVSLAGNAGHQAALVAGLMNVGQFADAVITMDADLEHPFEVAGQLLSRWIETGAIVVHAVRRRSAELGWVKRWPSAMFYRFTAKLTGIALVSGQADFRLWDGSALRAVLSYLPHVGSLRVFAAWMPGKQDYVFYDQLVQPGRRTRFTFRKNYELAAISIVRFSQIPLRAITAIGGVGLTFSFFYAIFIAIKTVEGKTVPGWSSTVLTVMSMGCLQLLSVGILASYLRRLVFARDLPLYVIREMRVPPQSNSAQPVGDE